MPPTKEALVVTEKFTASDKQPKSLTVSLPPAPEIQKKALPKKLYWFGMLPDAETKKLWNPPPEEPELFRWIGKCPWFQNIGVPGIEFPAFQMNIDRQHMSAAMPGHIAYLDDEQVKSIIHNVSRRVVREHRDGVDENGKPKRGAKQLCIDNPDYVPDVRNDKPIGNYLYFVPINEEFDRPQSMNQFFANPPTSMTGN